MQPKVSAIGALIGVAFVLCGVGVFTPAWAVVSASSMGYSYSVSGGIVPWYSDEFVWASVGSWCMFISFGLYFPMALIYLHASFKVNRHGCCHEIRHNFNGIALIASLITVLTAVAFTLFAINVPQSAYSQYGNITESLGYSAYLSLASAILTCIISFLAGHVARRDCH